MFKAPNAQDLMLVGKWTLLAVHLYASVFKQGHNTAIRFNHNDLLQQKVPPNLHLCPSSKIHKHNDHTLVTVKKGTCGTIYFMSMMFLLNGDFLHFYKLLNLCSILKHFGYCK